MPCIIERCGGIFRDPVGKQQVSSKIRISGRSCTTCTKHVLPYETTQTEYMRIMGENPSTFTGDDLPVENISWLEAIRYANVKSTDQWKLGGLYEDHRTYGKPEPERFDRHPGR